MNRLLLAFVLVVVVSGCVGVSRRTTVRHTTMAPVPVPAQPAIPWTGAMLQTPTFDGKHLKIPFSQPIPSGPGSPAFTLENPYRIVVDTPGTRWSGGYKEIAVGHHGVKKIKLNRFSTNVSRVVLELERPMGWKAVRSAKKIVVTLDPNAKAPSIPQSQSAAALAASPGIPPSVLLPASARLLGVNFKNDRLVIRTRTAIRHTDEYVSNSNTIRILLYDTSAQPDTENINTGPIKECQISNLGLHTQIDLRLSETVPYNIEVKDGGKRIEVVLDL